MKKLISMDATKLHHAEFGQLIIRFYEDFAASALNAETDPDFKRMYEAIQARITAHSIRYVPVKNLKKSLNWTIFVMPTCRR
jgi:hypothetical protein